MERASSGSGSPPNSSESLNGLKFGKKIYFEDVGIGVPFKSSGGSSSLAGSGNPSSSPVPAKKVKSGSCGSGSGVTQIPRCQVEGCKLDLSDSKAYYSRHKVCGMHSKSPKVVVSGLEQRFCQQCSRFHQLPEFDQGKRSCRRRLAGHNERRRKPPPGCILPSRYGRPPSSIFESSGHGGSFLLDFSSHQRLPERDLWTPAKSPDRVTGNQTTATGKFLSTPWENNNDNSLSNNLFLQGSSNATGFPGPSFPAGDFFAGVSESGCALSLLSSQPWSGSRPRSSDLEVGNFVHTEGAPFGHSPAPQVAPINHFQTSSWPFKGNDGSAISHTMVPDLGIAQMSQPHNSQFSCEFESSSQRNGKQYMELEQPRADYSSPTHHVHWSL